MSVDLSLILPNECQSLDKREEARRYFESTIDRVTQYFHGRKQFVTNITIKEDKEDEWDAVEYSFEIPALNITALMHAGFWDIWPVARYSHYFQWHEKDINGQPSIWARDVCFNVAQAFGFDEAWICDEFHSWNGPNDYAHSFEEWKNYGNDVEDRTVYEFNQLNLDGLYVYAKEWPEYYSKYHDDFKECHAVVDTLNRKFPQYEFLAILVPLPHHALVAKGDDLYILDMKSGGLLTEFPIEDCHADFNGAGIQVFRTQYDARGNAMDFALESAFFNREGKRLTDYRVGDFSWAWDHSNRCPNSIFFQVIKDHATGKQFYTDGTPYADIEQS